MSTAKSLSPARAPVRRVRPEEDVATALHRMELRAWLRSLSDAERWAVLDEGDPEVLAAVLSALPGLSGLTDAEHGALARSAGRS